jgi:ribosomal-protein-alanine N-acetyltransferase
MSVETLPVEIRPASFADMPAVLRIDSESFDDAWMHEKFSLRLMPSNCVLSAAGTRDALLGYVAYSFDDEHLRIMRLAVDSQYRRSGVGTKILRHLVATWIASGPCNRIMIEVRSGDWDAYDFLRAFGFVAVAVIPRFFVDTDEDAILMQYRLKRSVS